MNRKGITPIIAIVLLLMMTVAAGGLAWTFILNTMESQQTKTTKELSQMGAKSLQVLQIQNHGLGWNATIRNPGDPVALKWDYLIVKINGKIIDLTGKYSGTTMLNNGENTELLIDWTTNDTDFPEITEDPVLIEIEMNSNYRFSYSCKASPANPQYC